MTHIILVKTPALLEYDGAFFTKLEHHLGRSLSAPEDWLDIDSLPNDLQREVDDYTALHPKGWREQPPAPLTPKPSEPQISMADFDADLRQELQAAIHQREAELRLQFWEQTHGLVRDEHNLRLLTEFVNNSTVRGYWSQQIADAGVSTLRRQLHWESPKKVVAPPPPAEPAEVLGTLPNGEPMLSLLHPPDKHASVAQLKDYLARLARPKWNPVKRPGYL